MGPMRCTRSEVLGASVVATVWGLLMWSSGGTPLLAFVLGFVCIAVAFVGVVWGGRESRLGRGALWAAVVGLFVCVFWTTGWDSYTVTLGLVVGGTCGLYAGASASASDGSRSLTRRRVGFAVTAGLMYLGALAVTEVVWREHEAAAEERLVRVMAERGYAAGLAGGRAEVDGAPAQLPEGFEETEAWRASVASARAQLASLDEETRHRSGRSSRRRRRMGGRASSRGTRTGRRRTRACWCGLDWGFPTPCCCP